HHGGKAAPSSAGGTAAPGTVSPGRAWRPAESAGENDGQAPGESLPNPQGGGRNAGHGDSDGCSIDCHPRETYQPPEACPNPRVERPIDREIPGCKGWARAA